MGSPDPAGSGVSVPSAGRGLRPPGGPDGRWAMDGNGPAVCQRCTRIFEPHEGAWSLPAAACPQCAGWVAAMGGGAPQVRGCPACLLTDRELRRLEFVRWLVGTGRLES